MYFPYLRGRQFELIALRELVEKQLLSDKVIPIVEPVKLSATLVKLLQTYYDSDKKIAFIKNPQVGNFITDWNEEKNERLKEKMKALIINNNNIIFAHYFNKNSDAQLPDFIGRYNPNIMTICDDRDYVSIYEKRFRDVTPMYNLIPDESGFRRHIKDNRVMFSNKFNKQNRNTDYADADDESFSDDHIYYKSDGYVGFSDYSIIGNEYSNTGFAPYAVAIHIVYFDEDNNIRIRHFVSDTNDDISDPAGKFKEAVEKLVKWNEIKNLDTFGIKAFIEMYNNETYPGLGTVKKLSLMHHLEIMSRYLDGEGI